MQMTFTAALAAIKTALRNGAKRSISIEFTSKSGQQVQVFASLSDGNLRPNSFRTKWIVDGAEMNKDQARKAIA